MTGVDLISLIKAVGYLGIFIIIFAESGLFIGFFLPGDSLLFTAGFLASRGYLNLPLLAFLTFIAAILGDNFGYAFGRRVGPAIFKREDSIFFHKDHLERAKTFYEKHGRKTIVLARFIPFVRTFAPILSGVGKMNYRTFLGYNILGAALWAVGLSSLGYYLGNVVKNIDLYLWPIIGAVIVVSTLPNLIYFLRMRKRRNR